MFGLEPETTKLHCRTIFNLTSACTWMSCFPHIYIWGAHLPILSNLSRFFICSIFSEQFHQFQFWGFSLNGSIPKNWNQNGSMKIHQFWTNPKKMFDFPWDQSQIPWKITSPVWFLSLRLAPPLRSRNRCRSRSHPLHLPRCGFQQNQSMGMNHDTIVM